MNASQEQTVFVVDDDAAARDSIAELVDSIGLHAEVHASAQAFLDAFQPQRPGCLVLDVRMAGMSGLQLQDRLNAMGSRLPIIVLTGHGDVPMAVKSLKAGAIDFLQKPCRDQDLLDSITAALAVEASARRSRSGADTFERRLATLTPREREVLERVLAGKSSKEIAAALGISPRTAEAHRRNLLHKFGVATAVELIALSSASGLAR